MSWVSIKTFFKKLHVWCVQHWRWLVFALVALFAYIAGRKNAKNLWLQAEIARKQYKRESEAIERANIKKQKKLKKAEKEYDNKIDIIDKKRTVDINNLSKQEQENIRDLLSSPEKIDQALRNKGIDEV